MAIDSATAIQYSGYFYWEVKRALRERETEEADDIVRVRRILEEERKKVQPVYETRGKRINLFA